MHPREQSEICAVITTYRPDDGFPERVQRVRHQVGCIVIVDDSGLPEMAVRLQSWFSDCPGVVLLHHGGNLGIAAALNHGVSLVRQSGYQWVLTLDDDSVLYDHMVERLCQHLGRIESERPVGIIGMTRVENNGGAALRKKAASPVWLDKRGIITSGSLLPLATYDAVGPFREEFIIDSVDYDYCMRARAKGFRVIQVQEDGFVHSLGERESFKWGNIQIETASHSPARLYYNFRNSTILAKEYIGSDPLFACATLWSDLRLIMRILFLQKNKAARLRAVIGGFADAIKGKTGKCERYHF